DRHEVEALVHSGGHVVVFRYPAQEHQFAVAHHGDELTGSLQHVHALVLEFAEYFSAEQAHARPERLRHQRGEVLHRYLATEQIHLAHDRGPLGQDDGVEVGIGIEELDGTK